MTNVDPLTAMAPPRRTPYSALRTQHSALPLRPRPRRGTILVMTMWIVVILTALVLVFAREMRVEVISTGNRLGAQQASAIEKGAEQYVLSLVDAAGGVSSNVTNAPAGDTVQGMPVGDGYFWIIRPDPELPRNYAFGIVDEASKLNLNSATPAEILDLPDMTQDVADAIGDWRDPDLDVEGQGAETEYYQSTPPEPYRAKNGSLETVEELFLVRGVTEQLMWGYDLNQDGTISDAEQAAGGTGTKFNTSSASGRGIFPFVTVYSTEPNSGGGGGQRADVNEADPAENLRRTLQEALGQGRQQRAEEIVTLARSQWDRERRSFSSVLDFAAKGNMTPEELRLAADRLAAVPPNNNNQRSRSQGRQGLVNVNTAPREVLLCLPGLEVEEVDALVSRRTTADTSNIAWVYEALPREKVGAVGSRITTQAYQYSADIVAVTGDGRAFKRVRIVVDGSQSPARIVYRKDLTALGWPLPEELRDTLRSGNSL